MSYDLFFKSGNRPLSKRQLTSYFAQRDCYTIKADQALYSNEDTGVYFCFDYVADNPLAVAFNLNYFRPHFFGLEAAREVSAFVATFGLSLHDPQVDGMGDGPFSTDGFLRGWNAGNRFGYKTYLSSDDRPQIHVYPTSGLEQVWNWNFNRKSLQDHFGDGIFVPIIMFMGVEGRNQARTSIVWPDAHPIYMPKTDLVFLIRDELSSSPGVNGSYETTVVEWSEIELVIGGYPYDEKTGCYRLEYDSAPPSLSDFVRAIPLVPHDRIAGLPYDTVLNAELVNKVTKAG